MREAKKNEAPSKNLTGYYSSCVYPRYFDGIDFVFQFLWCYGEEIKQFLLDLSIGDGSKIEICAK
ncbi:hypothetical protein D3C78_1524000 [compost metagenome]